MQFRRDFWTERDCLRYLLRHKWHAGLRCPRCGHDPAWLLASQRMYHCNLCNHQTSLTAYTVVHETRRPPSDWLCAIFLVAARTTGSASTRQLQYNLGISCTTVGSWRHKIHRVGGRPEKDHCWWHPNTRDWSYRVMQIWIINCLLRKSIFTQKLKQASLILSNILSMYQPYVKSLYPLSVCVCNSQWAVEIFADVHGVITWLKTWIRGTHTHILTNLERYQVLRPRNNFHNFHTCWTSCTIDRLKNFFYIRNSKQIWMSNDRTSKDG